jgi:hypothetical protein
MNSYNVRLRNPNTATRVSTVQDPISTASYKVFTRQESVNNPYYLTFVGINSATAVQNEVYTNPGITYNPYTISVSISTVTISSNSISYGTTSFSIGNTSNPGITSFIGNISISGGTYSPQPNQLAYVLPGGIISGLNIGSGLDIINGSLISLGGGGVGSIGATGATGPIGIGSTGATGPVGISGATGPTGPQGPIGIGITGATGPIGITGATGPSGLQGVTGSIGITGATGPQGPGGDIGSTGPIGATGPSGLQGIAGNDGQTGPTGASGPIGITGATGPIGITGATGPSGVDGDRYHTTSTSTFTIGGTGNITVFTADLNLDYSIAQTIILAYDLNNHQHCEVNSYNKTTGELTLRKTTSSGSGTYSLWEINLDGAVGIQGATGPTGPQGSTGSIGETGATGPAGISGATGPIGVTGATGVIGISGATGPQGPAGNEGATGPIGATGASGKTILSGSGAPSIIIGTDGDYYLDTTSSIFYGPKTTGVWGSGISLIGPTGATGPIGVSGATGPIGITGATGPIGVSGATGPIGITGATGVAGIANAPSPLSYNSGTQTISLPSIGDGLILVISNKGETATQGTNYLEWPVPVPSGNFTITTLRFGCHIDNTGSSSTTFNAYRRTAAGVKTTLMTGNAALTSGSSLVDATTLLIAAPTLTIGDRIGIDLIGVGTNVQGLFAQFTFTRSPS